MISEQIEPIEQIEIYPKDKLKRMTTIIAIKCHEGIVLASDSQATSPISKEMEVSKIFQINTSMGIGGAGNEGHIKVLVQALRQEFGEEEFDSEPELKKRIIKVLLELHKFYNVDPSRFLGFQNIQYFFQPYALLGVKLSDNSFYLYHITPQPWVDWIDNYQVIGSGFQLANLVLKQQSRLPKFENKKFSDLPLVFNIWVTSYAINEVKALEPNTGGNTKVALIDKDGFKEIPDDEQQKFYNNIKENISKLGNRLFDEQNKIDLAGIIPDN